jgi:glyoxylase-like metal-dependent hydrolase (beta-lactamase superfamily II)
MKIAPGIHRIGDRSIVNSYLLEDAGEVTVIDAGVPGHYRDIPGELALMGRTVADVRALVLTHGHTVGDGATLDVPGSPRVILTPGHTPGSAVLHVPSRNVLFVGDALATYAVTTGARGPQVAPFTADAAQAVASLARLEAVSADVVLPGHGDPWTAGVQEAVRQVRQGAATRD